MKFLISVPYARTIPVLRMKCKKGTQTANVQSSGGSLFNELMLALLQLIQPNHYTVLEPNHVIYVHLALNSAFSNFAATKMNISCSGQSNLLYSNAQRKKLLDAEQLCLADSMHIAIPHNINTTQHIVGLFAAKFGNWEDDRQQGSDVSILPIYAICIKHFLWRSPSLWHGIRMEYTKHILIVWMIILFRNSMDRRQTIYWTRLVHSYCEGVLYLDVNISKDMQNTCFKCPVSQCIGLEHMEIGCARNISKFCICSDCINRIS